MNSEERHQLLTNDLGVVTTRTVGFFERHLGTLIGAVSLILLLAGGIYFWTQTSGTETATGWTMLDTAQNLEEFGTVVDKYKGKPPGQWAQLFVAETNLKTALPLMFSNREIAIVDLKSAREGFESLLQQSGVDPTIRERALWGFALCLESTSDGNTTKAVEAYEKLIQEFPESIFKTVAEERAAALKRDTAKDFYAWFSRENPKPPDARPRDFKNDSGRLGGDDATESPDDFLIQGPKGGAGSLLKGPNRELKKDLLKDPDTGKVEAPKDAEEKKPADEKSEAPTDEKSNADEKSKETPETPESPVIPEKTEEKPSDPAPSSSEEKPTEKE